MQIADVFCYAVFAITITTSCIAAEKHENHNNELDERKTDKRVRRQESTMLIDNFPMETIYQKPKVINYRRISRISKQRYGPPPSPSYGPPRPKYGHPKPGRKPGKKYKGKYGSSVYRKSVRRTPKPKSRYGPPKRSPKPFSPPRKPQYSYYPPEPVGFGEPPSNFGNDFQPKPNYGEPPVDSYGAPLKSNLNDLYPSLHNLDAGDYHDEFSKFGQQYQSWNAHRNHNMDSSYSSSKRVPSVVKPQDIFVTPIPQGNEEILMSYSEVYDHRQNLNEQKQKNNKKRNPQMTESTKIITASWKPKHKPDEEDEIIVGGQYAEPPARYVPKFTPSAPMYQDDEFPAGQYDSEGAASAPVSTYVNYKNSNMAFSPQNLNDAFSIVD